MTGFRVRIQPAGEVWSWEVQTQRDPADDSKTPGDWWVVRLLGSSTFGRAAEGTERTEEKARRAARRALGEAAAERAVRDFDAAYKLTVGSDVTV